MIWCVEDDAGVREIELYTLRQTGFAAEGFQDGAAMFDALKRQTPQLIVLDVMLPGMDGVQILKRLKENPKTAALPVIMATAKGAEYDKIMALDLGADDYLVKPFGMLEMLARVRAVLRRAAPGRPAQLTLGAISLDTRAHTATANGARVELTLKEFELLQLLMAHPGTVFTRERLLSDVWEMDYDGETRTVDVHIRTLRTKLGACGAQVETVRGLGYKMEGESV